MPDQGMLVIISGPSGSGKGTVVKKLSPQDNFALSVSVTTRAPRLGEIDGIDYFFCSQQEFKNIHDQDGFLEHAQFCGNFYGTPRSYVQEQIKKNKFVVLEIDVNGALQVKKKFTNCVSIFIVPPSLEELARRLMTRNTESKESIEDRLYRAHEEIGLIEKYDYLIINNDIQETLDKIKTVVAAENLKPFRNLSAINILKNKI